MVGGVRVIGVCGRGRAWQGEHAWWRACMVEAVRVMGVCGRGHVLGAMHGEGHAWQGGVRGRYYEIQSMSGRYAFHWNAFLFTISFFLR